MRTEVIKDKNKKLERQEQEVTKDRNKKLERQKTNNNKIYYKYRWTKRQNKI